jgi:hypothetical protein
MKFQNLCPDYFYQLSVLELARAVCTVHSSVEFITLHTDPSLPHILLHLLIRLQRAK